MVADVKGMREMAVLTPATRSRTERPLWFCSTVGWLQQIEASYANTPSNHRPHPRLRRRRVPLRPLLLRLRALPSRECRWWVARPSPTETDTTK